MITDAKAALDAALAGREPDDDTMPRYGMVRLKHLTALREQLAHLEYAERVLNEGLLAAYRNNASAYTERNAALDEIAALRGQVSPVGEGLRVAIRDAIYNALLYFGDDDAFTEAEFLAAATKVADQVQREAT